jgi:hypothetical protein
MPGNSKRVYFLAVLLACLFFVAQLHCCVDLGSKTADSHVCPICSTVGAAVSAPSLILATVPAINRLEVFGLMAAVLVVVSRNVAPRAPPVA